MNEDIQTAAGIRRFALVTGASSGIGRAIAVALSCASFTVILTARRRDALVETAAMIQPPDACVACIPCDLADPDAVRLLAQRVREITDDQLTLLVNCAGVFHRASFADTRPAALDELMNVNFRAPFVLTQQLLPALRSGPGTVVFINSMAAINATAHVSAYSASKAALKAAADSLRDEFAAEDLRVLSVFSGRTDTPMGQKVFELEGRDAPSELLIQPGDVAAAVVAAVTLPTRAQVTNIQVTPGRRVSGSAPVHPRSENASTV